MPEQSKEERVHHVFEKIYSKYDSMNSIISFRQHKTWRKDAMKRMEVEEGSKALDIWIGVGNCCIALSEVVGQSGEVIGLDFSDIMLYGVARKKAERQLNITHFIHGNAMERSYTENSWVYVTLGFGLRNVRDYLTVLD